MSVSQINAKLLDNVKLVKLTRSGIQYDLFEDIMKASSYIIKEWSKFLHLTERTIQRYKKEQKSFEPIQFERILKIAQLQQKGNEVFGSNQYFNDWMNSTIVALGNIKLVELLYNGLIINILMNKLGRIEHRAGIIVYRLTKGQDKEEVSGIGAELYGGKWNNKGTRIIYTGKSRALCTTEITVHTPLSIVPHDYYVQIVRCRSFESRSRWIDRELENISTRYLDKKCRG
jgi:putative toxin-antitoxin system antitoxin component (TIGR02293 family)